MKLRSLQESIHGMVDLGIVLTIGMAFAGLMVIAYIIFTVRDQLLPDGPWVDGAPFTTWTAAQNASHNATWNSVHNITTGWDNAVGLLLVGVTITILAIAIMALLMLRGRKA